MCGGSGLGKKTTCLGLENTSWFELGQQHWTQDMNSDLLGESPGLFCCLNIDAEGLTLEVVESLRDVGI